MHSELISIAFACLIIHFRQQDKVMDAEASFFSLAVSSKTMSNNFRSIAGHSRRLWWFINVTKNSRCIYNLTAIVYGGLFE